MATPPVTGWAQRGQRGPSHLGQVLSPHGPPAFPRPLRARRAEPRSPFPAGSGSGWSSGGHSGHQAWLRRDGPAAGSRVSRGLRDGGLGPLLHFQTRLRAASEGGHRGHGAGLAGSPASSQAPSLSCRCGRRGFRVASARSVFSGERLGWSRCPVRGEAGTAKGPPPNAPTPRGPGTEFQAFPRLACATGLLPRPP